MEQVALMDSKVWLALRLELRDKYPKHDWDLRLHGSFVSVRAWDNKGRISVREFTDVYFWVANRLLDLELIERGHFAPISAGYWGQMVNASWYRRLKA